MEKQEKEVVFPSRKAFRKAILPAVGTMIGDCKVVYVHDTKMRFTAAGRTMPELSSYIPMNGPVFQVEYVDVEKHRFGARFIGFEKPAEPAEQPRSDTSEIAKIID